MNGIPPEQDEDAQTFREAGERYRPLMAGKHASAGWNLGHGLWMMRQST